ncbi:carbohydrate porin, partial [Bradyrhizobium elkanii]|uniref:carbohydrate porin n=1 Tax=Bradyrhizobium elkanii TaxID=29448 RepID=UPI0023EDE179
KRMDVRDFRNRHRGGHKKSLVHLIRRWVTERTRVPQSRLTHVSLCKANSINGLEFRAITWPDMLATRRAGSKTVSHAKKRLSRLLFAAMLLAAGTAVGQEDKKTDDDKPADPDTGESTVEEKTLGLLPNPLQKYGVKFAATYIGEVLGNPSGGLKQGSVYEGRLNLAVDLDLQKLAGLDKLTFHANMFQIHGGGLSRGSLQNYFVVSGIEALPSTRLYEAYFEKQWGDKKISLKARSARR